VSLEGNHPSKRYPRRSGGSRSGTTLDSLAVLVTRDTLPAESRQYFDQAEIDGEVFVFHT
jgi:hypothetical protein